mmetsp:Transcript_65342/g.105870  ORF Transcript_65342/g.105870 Transcript_65342/m.105870 type:complete len:261 (-) Transcript_65342:694-1476(-)
MKEPEQRELTNSKDVKFSCLLLLLGLLLSSAALSCSWPLASCLSGSNRGLIFRRSVRGEIFDFGVLIQKESRVPITTRYLLAQYIGKLVENIWLSRRLFARSKAQLTILSITPHNHMRHRHTARQPRAARLLITVRADAKRLVPEIDGADVPAHQVLLRPWPHLRLAHLLDLSPSVELADAINRSRRGATRSDKVEILDSMRSLEKLNLARALSVVRVVEPQPPVAVVAPRPDASILIHSQRVLFATVDSLYYRRLHYIS